MFETVYVKPSIVVINYLPVEQLAQNETRVLVLARFEGKNYPLFVAYLTDHDGKPYYALYRNTNHHLLRANTLDDITSFGYNSAYELCRESFTLPACDCPKCTEE